MTLESQRKVVPALVGGVAILGLAFLFLSGKTPQSTTPAVAPLPDTAEQQAAIQLEKDIDPVAKAMAAAIASSTGPTNPEGNVGPSFVAFPLPPDLSRGLIYPATVGQKVAYTFKHGDGELDDVSCSIVGPPGSEIDNDKCSFGLIPSEPGHVRIAISLTDGKPGRGHLVTRVITLEVAPAS